MSTNTIEQNFERIATALETLVGILAQQAGGPVMQQTTDTPQGQPDSADPLPQTASDPQPSQVAPPESKILEPDCLLRQTERV